MIVLAVHFFGKLKLDTLWIQFGVGKHIKFIAVHEIFASMAPSVFAGLLFFHAFTGVDTVSAFHDHGKKLHGRL